MTKREWAVVEPWLYDSDGSLQSQPSCKAFVCVGLKALYSFLVVNCPTCEAELSQAKWPNKVGSFLVSLYPVIRIAVGLGTTAAEVCALMEAER